MKIRWLTLLLAGLLPMQAMAEQHFVIYYSDKAPISAFAPYDLVVLDSDAHPPLAPLLESGKTVLGYISLGEVEHNRAHFMRAKKAGFLLQENKDWPGSFMTDVRNPAWTKMVIEELIPAILAQGFKGIFLDTLDNPPELERNGYSGMTQAAVNLVKAIRMHYPDILIMMNRGYELLPDVATSINMELGESIYTDYKFNTKTYGYVKASDYREQVRMLKDAQKLNPDLTVYTLDYWNPKDTKTIAKIYKTERENGFIPYVATVSLTEIVHEPAHQ
jgi:uncharacterized protein (TIGR01370 family)